MISIVSMKLFLISYDSMKCFYEIISDYIRFYEISMKFFLISYDSMKLLIRTDHPPRNSNYGTMSKFILNY